MRLLEHEGLLESEPNRGFSVKPIGADEIDEIYDLRIVLESHALQLAVPLLTDADLADLRELFEAMEAVENREERRIKREEFYFRLYSVPARPRLLSLIVTMRRELSRSLRWYAVPASEAHHRAFFEAVMQGDVHTAEKLLTTHYRKVASLLRRFIREAELRQRATASEQPAARTVAGHRAGSRLAHRRGRDARRHTRRSANQARQGATPSLSPGLTDDGAPRSGSGYRGCRPGRRPRPRPSQITPPAFC